MTDSRNVRAQAPLAPGMRPRPSAVEIGSVVCGLFAFITLAIWGFAAWPFPWNIVAGIGAPALAILVWALFVSPRAVLAVHPFIRAIVELFVYAAATIAWWSMGQAVIGLVFAIVAVVFGALNGRRRLA
ncbi:YrdB family protein [Microbacterium sp. VKM Ac-2923]|uniref:YrdB family protein n=1 Tax=Microbacterium sp. VKM Ac-2923 TaxID=2929476 RepID=UPI001FB53B5F|nr:YrdB family protein [Microbacterium sp. VKM Ac-2923]MCJ1706592.1 YrdB family protein [Microbacterium sp. VKM Ac-2923]